MSVVSQRAIVYALFPDVQGIGMIRVVINVIFQAMTRQHAVDVVEVIVFDL